MPYANAANEWAKTNRGKQVFKGMLLTANWGTVMPQSTGTFDWSEVESALSRYAAQSPYPLAGAVTLRDKFWHTITVNGTSNQTSHSTYVSCIPEDLVEYSSPGFSDGYIAADDPAGFPSTLANGKKYRNETHRWVVLDIDRKFVKYAAKRWDPAIRAAFNLTLDAAGNSASFGRHPALKRLVLDESSPAGTSNINDLVDLDYPDAAGVGYADEIVGYGQHARQAFPASVEVAYNLNWIPPNNAGSGTLQDRAVGGVGRSDSGFLTALTPLDGGNSKLHVGLYAQDLVASGYLSDYSKYVYSQFKRYANDPASPTSAQITGETWTAFGQNDFGTEYEDVLLRASNIDGAGNGVRQLYFLLRDTAFAPNLQSNSGTSKPYHYHNLVWTAISRPAPTGLSFMPY